MQHAPRRKALLATAALAAAALGLSLPAAAQTKAGEPLKVGFVYIGPIGDAGWTSQHDTGARRWRRRSAPR